MEYILQNTYILWLVFAGFCFLVEAMGIPGAGFLFAGMGAITTGGLLSFGMIDSTNTEIEQLAVFFASTCVWTAILWPILRNKNKGDDLDDFINIKGQEAVITEGAIHKGKVGKIAWSGTTMKAKLSNDCPLDSIEDGETVIIDDMVGITAIITTPQASN
mgnify:CR=1 FL=1|tara:strand:+ start:21 stop:500 length:480 start_codon:yes stop_codon:yes gene_type:complete